MLPTTRWRSELIQTQASASFTFAVRPEDYQCMSAVGVLPTNWIPDTPVWIFPEQEVAKIVVELFKMIPQVEAICAQFRTNEIALWTLLDSYDRMARGQVYEKELELCQHLNAYDFDFRVTSVDLVSPADLVKTGFRQIYSRRSTVSS